MKGQRKYNNRKVVYDGITFDSVKECKRYKELQLKLAAGEIRNLQMQVPFELLPSQRGQNGKVIERPCIYKADFVYYENESDRMVVEDTKGYRTKEYKIKKKLMLYRYDIRISEV